MSDKRKLLSLAAIVVMAAHWIAAQAVWILSHPFSFNRYYIGIYYILCILCVSVGVGLAIARGLRPCRGRRGDEGIAPYG
ncbi:MAG: hypothetical protein FWD58_01070 [Firmicutes bacterium]|nr:hypothetical protein [Bacillota bacterium]